MLSYLDPLFLTFGTTKGNAKKQKRIFLCTEPSTPLEKQGKTPPKGKGNRKSGAKGSKKSECKLSNGRSRSYKVINCFFLQGNQWSRSYREINQHPSLPGTLLPIDFWTPPEKGDKKNSKERGIREVWGSLAIPCSLIFHRKPTSHQHPTLKRRGSPLFYKAPPRQFQPLKCN